VSPAYEGNEPLRFRGTPGSLSASIQEPESTPRRLAIHVELAKTRAWEGGEKFVARATRVESDMVLQMTLPARTPPGTYEGIVEVAGVERPVVIEVEPEVELQIVPDQLTLSGAPGDHLAADVSIANAGNVAVELRKAYAFGIFAAGGLERALHRTYTEKRAEGERRVDFLFDKLAEEHGGVVRVAVEKGAGDLEPGETREVRLNFHLPSTLQGGRTYTGTLAIHDLRYYVRLFVKEKKEPPPGREPR
jgi:hypothetical protein